MNKLFVFPLLCPLLAQAEPSTCTITTPQDVVTCAQGHHPDVVYAKARVQSARLMDYSARQPPNPEAEAQSTSFRDGAEPGLKVEANLLHTFELGGKKSKRRAEARSQVALAEAELQKVQEETVFQTILHLYRLRQLRVEMQTLDESIHTFGKVVQAFQSRSVRSSEQEVSLNVFALAKSEHALRKSSLLQEHAVLESYFETATGVPFEKITAALPPERKEWPDVSSGSGPVQTAARRQMQSLLQLTESQQAAATGAAWPDLKVGPRLETNSGHGQSNQGYGLALSLPLPLYQRNEGGRRLAESHVETAKLALLQKENALEAERKKWRRIYQQALSVYSDEPSMDDIHQKHHSLEALFERGLVSATLVIEAHRQVAEYVNSRHEQESRALEALWSLYALNGSILNEGL